MARWVVHCKKDKYDVYIGRAVLRSALTASIWGNPFVIRKNGTRELANRDLILRDADH